MFRRIWAITQKEILQTVRDRGTLAIILAVPMIQLILFATAIHMDVKHVPMAVSDGSRDAESRKYLNALTSSEYFDVVEYAASQEDVAAAIDRGDARVGVVIPPDFAGKIERKEATVLFYVDGSDPFTTQSAYNAANAIAQQYSSALTLQELSRSGQGLSAGLQSPLVPHIRILYNPDLKDLFFLIPGMIAMLLQTQTITLTALAVVREREVGTIEQILVTPIRPFELMIGKTLPNLIIAVFNMLTIIVVGTIGFGVPFQGNFLVYVSLSILYACSGLGLGLVISSISQNQRQANQLTMMITFVGMIVSGFIFPQYTMPLVMRAISYLFPLTYFIPISRGIFTKGIGLEYLGGQILPLAIFVVVIIFFAARLFRQRLD